MAYGMNAATIPHRMQTCAERNHHEGIVAAAASGVGILTIGIAAFASAVSK